MPETFWFEEPLILVHPKYIHRFFPSERFHLAARMNAIVRCCLYIGVFMAMVRQQNAWLLLPVVSLGVTASWMYKIKPEMFTVKKGNHKKGKDKDMEYLASVILDGHPMKNVPKPKKKKVKKDLRTENMFRSTDDIMQDLQETRAKQTDNVSGSVPDTPNFARKLLGMDRAS